jgi:hypothetical protein
MRNRARWAIALALSIGSASTSMAQNRGADVVPDDLGLFRIARLHYPGGGDWYANPSSLPNLLTELGRRAGVRTSEREATVTLDDERLYSYPMLYVTGHGDIRLDASSAQRLRRYLDAGGFLWVDDNYGLDVSFRELAGQLYPESTLVAIGGEHPVYHAYYDLPGLPKIHEHDGEPAQAFGIFHEGRLAIFYSYSSDIGDGLEDAQVHGDPPAAREAAMKMAVNLCIYAMTQS